VNWRLPGLGQWAVRVGVASHSQLCTRGSRATQGQEQLIPVINPWPRALGDLLPCFPWDKPNLGGMECRSSENLPHRAA
jgi:hypothetical protein